MNLSLYRGAVKLIFWGQGDVQRPLLLANDPKKKPGTRAHSAAKTAIKKFCVMKMRLQASNTILVLVK